MKILPVTLILSLTLAGCLFDTRDPDTGGGVLCYEANDSATFDDVFENIDGSLECRQAFTYLDQIAEDFVYIPAPSEAANVVQPWGREEEERFISALVASGGTISSRSRVSDVNPPGGSDPVLVEATYEFTIGGTTYTGEVFYTLETNAGVFQITRWEEKDSNFPFAQLRGALVQ